MTQQVSAARAPSGGMGREPMPGLVLFAQVMMFIVAGFLLVVAISEWADSFWLYERSFTIAGNHLVVWGFIDFVLSCGAAYGAFALKDGKRAGQVITLTFAGVSAIRWLFYIPADPWLAVAILAIDSLIIYGVTAHDAWFSRVA